MSLISYFFPTSGFTLMHLQLKCGQVNTHTLKKTRSTTCSQGAPVIVQKPAGGGSDKEEPSFGTLAAEGRPRDLLGCIGKDLQWIVFTCPITVPGGFLDAQNST